MRFLRIFAKIFVSQNLFLFFRIFRERFCEQSQASRKCLRKFSRKYVQEWRKCAQRNAKINSFFKKYNFSVNFCKNGNVWTIFANTNCREDEISQIIVSSLLQALAVSEGRRVRIKRKRILFWRTTLIFWLNFFSQNK